MEYKLHISNYRNLINKISPGGHTIVKNKGGLDSLGSGIGWERYFGVLQKY